MRFEGALHHYISGFRELHSPSERLRQRLQQVPGEHTKTQPPKAPLPSKPKPSYTWLWTGWSLAGAVILVFLLWNSFQDQQNQKPILVPKGSPVTIHLEYARQHKGSQLFRQKAKHQQIFVPGDLIQFVYRLRKGTTPQNLHLMIICINAQGDVFSLAPFGGKQSVQLRKSAGTLPWGESLKIKGTSGQERYIALLGTRAFSFNQVQQTLKKAFVLAGKNLSRIKPTSSAWKQVWTLSISKQPAPRHQP